MAVNAGFRSPKRQLTTVEMGRHFGLQRLRSGFRQRAHTPAERLDFDGSGIASLADWNASHQEFGLSDRESKKPGWLARLVLCVFLRRSAVPGFEERSEFSFTYLTFGPYEKSPLFMAKIT